MRYTFSLDDDGLTAPIEKSSRSQCSDPWRKVAASWSEAESMVEGRGRDGLGFLVGVDGRVGLDWSGLDLTGEGLGDGTAGSPRRVLETTGSYRHSSPTAKAYSNYLLVLTRCL